MTSLKELKKDKLDVGFARLIAAGIDVDRWLALCNADDAALHRLAAAWPGTVRPERIPDELEIAVREGVEKQTPDYHIFFHPGFSFADLISFQVIKNVSGDVAHYGDCDWARRDVSPHKRLLRIPIMNSFFKPTTKQWELLLPDEVLPSVQTVFLFLALCKLSGFPVPLESNQVVRCAEQDEFGGHYAVGLDMIGRIVISPVSNTGVPYIGMAAELSDHGPLT